MLDTDKTTLFQVLCSMLPYGVICQFKHPIIDIEKWEETGETTFKEYKYSNCKVVGICTLDSITVTGINIETGYEETVFIEDCMPYLKDLDTMTNDEELEYDERFESSIMDWVKWQNEQFFDYEGLINKNIAIAITAENNPYKL